MLKTILTATVFSTFAYGAIADAQTDAQYIVDQTVTKDLFEGALSAQRPYLVSAIENDLRKTGITLPDPDRFFDIFVEEFIDEFTSSMQQQTASIYTELFTAQELSEIADFYATDAGQALVSQTPSLMMAGAQLGERAGIQAGQNASMRVAERLESEGIDLYEDPSLMKQLLDALR